MEGQPDYPELGHRFGKTLSPRLQALKEEFERSGGRFEKFRIGDLFDIKTGSLVSSRKLVKGDIPRLTVTSQNNGIIGYFDTEDIEEARHYENFISVNFMGNVFYHPYKASCEMKVHALKLKNHTFSRETGLYVASVIRKVVEGNYTYGEQLSSSDLKNHNIYILLPTLNNELAFSYMEQYVREVEAERVHEVEAYLVASGLNDYELTDEEREALSLRPKFKEFRIGDLFDIKKGVRLTKSSMALGKIKFIGATSENNGCTQLIGNNEHLHAANTITVCYNGSVGETFYQDDVFWASDDVNVLYFKHSDLNPEIGMYLMASIKKLKNRYGYSYKWTKKLMNDDKIHVPIAQSGAIDFDYMQTYISAIKKLVIADVVKWKDKELQAYKEATEA